MSLASRRESIASALGAGVAAAAFLDRVAAASAMPGGAARMAAWVSASTLLLVLLGFLGRRPVVGRREGAAARLFPLLCVALPVAIALAPRWAEVVGLRALPGARALFLPLGPGPHTAVHPAALPLLVVGNMLTAWSLWHLRHAFSVFVQARTLVTSGPYRWIRHPVYLGECTAVLGLALAFPSAMALAGAALFVTAQVVRARLEESTLAAAFPDYAAYRTRTLGVGAAP